MAGLLQPSPSLHLHSPGPSRYWESENRSLKMMGSVRRTFQAVDTSSCREIQSIIATCYGMVEISRAQLPSHHSPDSSRPRA